MEAAGRQCAWRRRQASQALSVARGVLSRAAGSDSATQVLIADVTCDEEGTVQIRLPPASSGGLERNFDRPRQESLGKTTARMAKTLAKKQKKKKKKKPTLKGRRTSDEDVSDLPAVEFLDAGGVPLGHALTLSQVFALGQAAILVAGACRYHLRVNRPKVLAADCRSLPVVGLPLLPNAEGRFCGVEDMRWEWRRASDSEVVGRERAYTPQPSDLDSPLQLLVRPPIVGDGLPSTGADEAAASAIFATAAATRPTPADVAQSTQRVAALEAAQAGSLAPGEEALRVVSYNTLADCYRHCWGNMFPYCDPETYRPELRLQLCRHELAAYRGDILCLQEVDARWFTEYWEPQLALDGYSGRYTQKVLGSDEGCALFVREEALEILELREFALSSLPKRRTGQGAGAPSPVEAAVGKLLESSPELADLWQRLGTVAQLALVRSRRSGRTLLVCNTHLYFADMARHVRMLQAALILDEAHRFASELAQPGGSTPALLFCGDLNSHPRTGAVEFLLEGRVKSSHQDWIKGACFKWGFASSRKAARSMTEAVKASDPAAAWRELAASSRKERSLQAILERCLRIGQSWEVLVQGHASAEAKDDGQAEEEEQLMEEEAASSAEGALAADGPTGDCAGNPSQAASQEWRVLQAALRAGGTFKNNPTVAAAQLALDAGLSERPLLELDDREREAVQEHLAALRVEAEAMLQQVAQEQEELSARAAAAGEGSARQTCPVRGACEAPGAEVLGVGIELRHHFHLASAYEETPEFTNFVGGYEATLDWILFDSSRLRRVASAPLPSRELVEECTALPSWRFPSDHLLLAADLAWPAGEGPGGEEVGS